MMMKGAFCVELQFWNYGGTIS